MVSVILLVLFSFPFLLLKLSLAANEKGLEFLILIIKYLSFFPLTIKDLSFGHLTDKDFSLISFKF